MKRPHSSRRPRGTAAAAVVVCLVFFTIAGVVHHHGLPGRAHASPALADDSEHHGALSAPCFACRSSHEQISTLVGAPTADPAPDESARALPCVAAPLGAPGRDAGGSRAPPSRFEGAI